MAARIVRGMHALLYKEFLPVTTKSKFHIPLPEADTDTKAMIAPLEQTFTFSGVIRKALLSGTADVVRAYNDKFKYVCTWRDSTTDSPSVLFALTSMRFMSCRRPLPTFLRHSLACTFRTADQSAQLGHRILRSALRNVSF